MNNGSTMVRLGEVCTKTALTTPEKEPNKSFTYVDVSSVSNESYRIVETTEMLGRDAPSRARKLIQTDDIIFATVRPTLRRIAMVPANLNGQVCSTGYCILRADRDKLEPAYLYFYLLTEYIARQVEYLQKGATYPAINDSDLFVQPIPLPPLPEQQRIVGRIKELAGKIEEARGLRRAAVGEAEALIVSYARKSLSQIDADVTELRCWLDDKRDGIQTGPFGAQLGTGDFTDSGVPVLTIGNVQYNGLRLNGLRYVTEGKAQQLKRFTVKEGDILFARMGTVGRCCVIPSETEGWLFNYHLIRVALDRSHIEPRFIHWTIQASADIDAYLDEKIRGATRQGVNSAIVGSLPCRVPPLPEQQRIVAYLDDLQAKVDAVKKLQAETARELEAMLPAVLDRAFKGEL